jgi:C-terminal processing protease CtpA/Prc
LHAEIDGVQLHANTGRSKTMKRLRAAFEKMPEPKSKGKVLGSFHRNIDKCVLEQVLGGKGKQVCANKFTWGLTHPDIGYLNISGMGGYSLGDTDAQVEALHKALDNILAELKDTKAIIIDISMNGGGSDLYSMEIAAHFADKKRLGFSKWPAAVKEYRNDRYVTPYTQTNPQGIAYTKPVYLVTNDYTASAAEIFTMCMRSFPHVTTVGTPTSGALSDVLDKSLPNDWTFHTSNEIYTDHEGVCHEGPGIPPDVTMDIFDKDDILKVVHHETIAKVVKLALERDGDGEGKNVQD